MPLEIKICGLTSADDANAALALGADYLGFVLYAASPRGIDAEAMRDICGHLPSGARKVGVFVNSPRAHVEEVARDCDLTAVQIHGDEEPRDFRDMPLPLWRAVRVANTDVTPAPETWNAERYVLDSAPSGRYGGSGVRGDWDAAARFAARHRSMLAGGLTAENVAEAVRRVRPAGVDVSSGIESAPGVKDLDKMRRFMESARRADAPGGGRTKKEHE